MNAKAISIVAMLVIIALAVTFSLRNKPKAVPTITPDEETILASQIDSLTEEQLAAISTDLTDFSTTTQNDIASSSSMFMYQ